MTWYRSLDLSIIIFIALFIVLYGLYIFRMFQIGKKFQVSIKRVYLKAALRTVYFVLFIIALLGPSFGVTSEEIKTIGKDIFIAVDLSASMNAHDVQPSRLEKVRFELKKMVSQFSSDKVGLIIFSSSAFVQCPLTHDQGALQLFIESLNTSLVPRAGTDFGPPLQLAMEKLNLQNERPEQQTAKVIIFISDGEDYGEETQNLAEQLKNDGISLFALGVGTEEGSRIRLERGGFRKDQDGNDVITRLNPSALKQLADATNGQYFEISDKRNDTNRMVNTVNNIEGEVRGSRTIDIAANKYYYLLALALFLLVMDMLLSIRTIKI